MADVTRETARPEIQVGDWVEAAGILSRPPAASLFAYNASPAVTEIRGERDGQPFIWRKEANGG